MPLTVQQNGSTVGGQPNVASASWWNDYHSLLTGTMTDQDISPKADLILNPIGANPATAPTLALAAGTTLGIGAYQYVVTFFKQGEVGESGASPTGSITTTTGNQAVNLSAIPLGPTGTAGRKLYRTTVGGASFLLVVQINDNTTTTYSDTLADGSLGAALPTRNSFGGRLIIKDASGNDKVIITPDGFINALGGMSVGGTTALDGGLITSNGSGTLTAAAFLVGTQVVPYFGGGSYSTARRIFVSPGTPTGATKGDIWVKTPF